MDLCKFEMHAQTVKAFSFGSSHAQFLPSLQTHILIVIKYNLASEDQQRQQKIV